MTRTRLALLSFAFLAAPHLAEAATSHCKRVLLRDEQRLTLLAEVRRFTEHDPDEETLSVCRSGGELFAQIRTVHVALDDGTGHWHATYCGRRARGRSAWKCVASQFRAFRAWPYAELPGVWVAIHPEVALAAIKPAALRAFAALEGAGSLGACWDASAPRKSLEEARVTLTDGGVVEFNSSGSGWSLRNHPHSVLLDQGIPCWHDEDAIEVTVTASTSLKSRDSPADH